MKCQFNIFCFKRAKFQALDRNNKKVMVCYEHSKKGWKYLDYHGIEALT